MDCFLFNKKRCGWFLLLGEAVLCCEKNAAYLYILKIIGYPIKAFLGKKSTSDLHVSLQFVKIEMRLALLKIMMSLSLTKNISMSVFRWPPLRPTFTASKSYMETNPKNHNINMEINPTNQHHCNLPTTLAASKSHTRKQIKNVLILIWKQTRKISTAWVRTKNN